MAKAKEMLRAAQAEREAAHVAAHAGHDQRPGCEEHVGALFVREVALEGLVGFSDGPPPRRPNMLPNSMIQVSGAPLPTMGG